MSQRMFEQLVPQAAPAVGLKHINVAKVGKGGLVGDKTGETNLCTTIRSIQPEAKGTCNGTGDGFQGNTDGPIAIRKDVVDSTKVEPGRVAG